MNKLSIALSVVLMLALVLIMAPSIFAMNRGKVLRNIAIWLAIFAGLGLYYKNFGPGRPPMPVSSGAAQDETPPPVVKDSGDKGFTPPKE
jgi:hypothetical protein